MSQISRVKVEKSNKHLSYKKSRLSVLPSFILLLINHGDNVSFPRAQPIVERDIIFRPLLKEISFAFEVSFSFSPTLVLRHFLHTWPAWNKSLES